MAIQWRDQPILDSVQLPGSDTKYWVADREAREKIESLIGATRFMGVTTTELEDGDTTNPITIDDKSYTAQTGDIVIYTPLTGPSLEFIWDGSKWQLLGGQAIEGLGDLAYKDSASGSYTPEGSVNLISEAITVVTGVSDNFSINASFNSQPVAGYKDVTLGFDVTLDTTSISYFGSSQAVEYINLAPDGHGTSYEQVMTNANLWATSVVTDFTAGDLASIANSSIITVAMGTGSSSTTLIFDLSDIGFNPGTAPSANYTQVYAPSSNSDFGFEYASVIYNSLEPDTANIPFNNASGTVPIYYSISLSGALYVNEGGPVVSGITATFSGTSSTITVS